MARKTIKEKAKEGLERLLGMHTEPRRDVALVLSSGGARGLAHVGAIDALLENGYRITSICGTSFGAVVAAMYASGHLEEFKEWMMTIDRKKINALTDFKPGLAYFVKGQRIIEEMQKFAPDCPIESLPIPFACVATDWKTGREVVFRKGSMWRAVRASISIPGTFLLSNDAFYLGVLPVLNQVGLAHGFSPMDIAVASTAGQAFHLLSPLVGFIYLLLHLTGVDMGKWQLTSANWAIGIFILFLIGMFVIGSVAL